MDRDDLMVDVTLPPAVARFLRSRMRSDKLALSLPDLPSLLGIAFARAGIHQGDTTWVFDSPLAGLPSSRWMSRIPVLVVTLTYDKMFRQYARLINHARPRKISWRRLNRQQKARAIELAKAGLL